MALSRKPPPVQLRVPFILHEFNTLLMGQPNYKKNHNYNNLQRHRAPKEKYM